MIYTPGLCNAHARLKLTRLFIMSASLNLTFTAFTFANATTQFQSSFMRQGTGQTTDAGNYALEALSKGHDIVPGRYWCMFKPIHNRLNSNRSISY